MLNHFKEKKFKVFFSDIEKLITHPFKICIKIKSDYTEKQE